MLHICFVFTCFSSIPWTTCSCCHFGSILSAHFVRSECLGSCSTHYVWFDLVRPVSYTFLLRLIFRTLLMFLTFFGPSAAQYCFLLTLLCPYSARYCFCLRLYFRSVWVAFEDGFSCIAGAFQLVAIISWGSRRTDTDTKIKLSEL